MGKTKARSLLDEKLALMEGAPSSLQPLKVGGTVVCDLIVVRPLRALHDSKYHAMEVGCFVKNGDRFKYIGRATGGSDVIDLTSGSGDFDRIHMDVPRLGYLQFWAPHGRLKVSGIGCSSLSVRFTP